MDHVNKKISVIIPVYNTEKYIEQCINSVHNQTYESIEIIVIDDGSDEQTKNKLKELSSKIDVLITQENKGQAAARNVGVKAAKTDFVVFVDSDDSVDKDFCHELLNNFNEKYSVVTTNANIVINDKVIDVFKPIGGGFKEVLKNNIALGTSLFFRKDLLAISGYDESMRKGFEDWEMLIRLLEYTHKQVFVVNKPLYNYRKGIVSTTTTANAIKYDLLKYIYNKHENLYKIHFKDFIDFLLNRVKKEEKMKIKLHNSLEYKLGTVLLMPIRFVKKIFNV
jgi:glycosyltransferase involved in cell wall biosynthesis